MLLPDDDVIIDERKGNLEAEIAEKYKNRFELSRKAALKPAGIDGSARSYDVPVSDAGIRPGEG